MLLKVVAFYASFVKANMTAKVQGIKGSNLLSLHPLELFNAGMSEKQ